MTLFGARKSQKLPHDAHPFGHGKELFFSFRKRNRGGARLFRGLEARPSPNGRRTVPARFRTLRMNWMRRLLTTPRAKLVRN